MTLRRAAAPLLFAGFFAPSFAPSLAYAQDASMAAAADALFQQGHQLFEAKRYAEACPKFAESYRLDPATGSLLALAACHEAEGKLASAWAEYNETVARARKDGRNDRADQAQQRAASLEGKLAKLTLTLGPGAGDVAGLQVKRDGVVMGSGIFGAPLPVDRGEHTIEATAPDHQPWTTRVTIADGAAEAVTIPRLADTAKSEPSAPPVASANADTGKSAEKSEGPPLRTIGLITGAVGVVAIGVGTYFGIQAISKNSDSNNDCTGDACGPTGKQTRLDAISAGNVSTVAFIAGGVLVAGGITLFIVGAPSHAESKPSLAAAPAVGTSSAGFVLRGRF